MPPLSAISNLAGLKGMASLNAASRMMATAMERLTTGKRINHGYDDPSGVQAVDQFKARIAKINEQMKTLDFQEHYMGARDGAESVIGDLLIELKGHAVAAANTAGLTDDERQALQTDADSIVKTIDYLSQTSTFNNQQILTGY